MLKQFSSTLCALCFMQASAQASEIIEYQQGNNQYTGATSVTFSGSRHQNAQRETHFFRYDGPQRYYNLEHFQLGDLTQKGAVESAKIIFYHVGGYSYTESEISVRQILDPDNLGAAYANGWQVGTGFRAGANNESRDDSGSSDVKWQLSDPDSPDDLNADYFSGILKSINDSPSFFSERGVDVGHAYEVDVTSDVQCIQSRLCSNQGWALYHQQDNTNIQNTTATSNYPEVQYRPKLVISYAPYEDTLEPLVVSSFPSNHAIYTLDNRVPLAISTNEIASCRFDYSPTLDFEQMRFSLNTIDGLTHSKTWQAALYNHPYQIYSKCMDELGNATQTAHVFTFTTTDVDDGDECLVDGGTDGGTGDGTGGGTGSSQQDLLPGLNTNDVVKTLYTNVNQTLAITLGNLNDASGLAIEYSVTGNEACDNSVANNMCLFASSETGTQLLTVNYSLNGSSENHKIIVVTQPASTQGQSLFVQNKNVINPVYTELPPAVGEFHIDPTTGAKIKRLTNTAMIESNDALIVYSRYSPENSSGQYILVFGSNSTSSWVMDRESGDIIAQLENGSGASIGESHEVRWDTSGRHPNRVYYVQGMQFHMIDDITNQEASRELIKDFSEQFPNAVKIYNDVEGDSSNDSDHWAWMAVHYGENFNNMQTYLVDAFIHYQVSTDTTHSLTPQDLAGSPLDLEKDNAFFKFRPNMIEMSPLGTGVMIHMGRKWTDADHQSSLGYVGTWFDGPHLWPVDFDYQAQTPVKISIGETHSGWSFDMNEQEMFISQNNRTDRLDAINVNGTNAGYDNRIEVASHSDLGWAMSFHYGKMPQSKPGWIFMNTYSKDDSLWGANQFMMIQIKPEEEDPIIWRISPAYNVYNGDYRDEAPAAINLSGNRIYWSSNWGGQLDHREVFMMELPDDWNDTLLNQ